MRASHALAFVLGLTRLGTACGGDGNGPSNAPPAAAFTPTCVLLACTFADSSTDADGQLTGALVGLRRRHRGGDHQGRGSHL